MKQPFYTLGNCYKFSKIKDLCFNISLRVMLSTSLTSVSSGLPTSFFMHRTRDNTPTEAFLNAQGRRLLHVSGKSHSYIYTYCCGIFSLTLVWYYWAIFTLSFTVTLIHTTELCIMNCSLFCIFAVDWSAQVYKLRINPFWTFRTSFIICCTYFKFWPCPPTWFQLFQHSIFCELCIYSLSCHPTDS